MNVDQQEIDKFEAMASRWWDPEGDFKPLHRLNPLRLDWIADKAGGLFGKQVIDIGCGGGILSESMAREGAEVTGVDMGREPLAVARLHALEAGVSVNYRQGTAEQLAAEQPGQFDLVTCMEMLEHVPEPASVVQACAELAKPGATLVFSTINRNPKAWLLMIGVAEHLLKMVPKGTHDHRKFITPAELCTYIERAGLVVKDISGVVYRPLTGDFKLSRDADVNYMVHAIKPE
ncbi:bifunctional 3-demethylubiquinol 3-O-methyltransferase/2-polyprenyl-6-hydroxyphenol methylase [Zobellella denitrificans]|jgi:2-polyprenyl-6-hydroxyphenyl methylase/3-demethylubiquinone-9 3-methyltransferase|uniref:Ubiquinone biosynthesis O-methyltransferase n=1 Tax=Zobellella denitrificans TaxID=347534 RepID=A0A231N2P9_9GAMM|nr:bifunctional 2-polyprenyl-6-hydroxyphenol methylase/3-demethylubiquinol 3-O-methyltransferase UbiG [Zobellella denitrificans]ATG74472.1 3-demethylubiquinone-9 3-methyltransferase [Zobellella denitrificans]OXS16385.1 bifunctional 3-demethylubiquinol 3-O-methyltransferase/2-polyprenyl-6-hydroxyphenol methylase [Zobellella denitrificans]